MTNQPNNPSQGSQSQGNTKSPNDTNSNTSRADQPTPISGSSQSQGSQSPTGNQPNPSGQAGSGDLKQQGRELANDAKNAVSNATSEVKSQVSDLTHSAQEQASNFLGEQKGVAAERIGGVADALRSVGQDLAGRDEGMLAQYTDTLAGQLDKFSNTLRDREIGSLLEDAKQIAYRQPELFVAGALAAGFVLGRFFKSSSRPSSNYQNAYSEFDPRDPSRIYGEQYGQGYGDQFSRNRGPDNSRDYDAGYRSGYQQEYGSPYSQGSQYNQSSSDQSREQWRTVSGPGSQASSERSGQGFQGPNTTQSSNEGSAQTSRPAMGQSPKQQAGQPTSQVTTHGVGSGQSQDREAELRRGQEFGQGEEQVSNYKGNETKTGSQASQEPNKREEGDVR